MKVVITGGAGFIGCNLVRRLLITPEISEIVVIDDLSTGRIDNLDDVRERIGIRELSILDTEAWADLGHVDAIVHLGALGSVPRSVAAPLRSNSVNVDGTLAVLEWARSQPAPPHVIFSSSSSVYGGNTAAYKQEELHTAPLSPYACSKLAGESYLLAYQNTYGVPALPFRFFNVYGPYQHADNAYAAVIPIFVAAAMAGTPFTVHGDGSQSRDFTHVSSVVEVITSAIVRRVTSDRPVNLAFGGNESVLQIAHMIAAKLGISPQFEYLATRPGDVRHSRADSTRVRSLFPELDPMDIPTGVADTIAWHQSRKTLATG
jgi:UDP-glucose 4-epimerase